MPATRDPRSYVKPVPLPIAPCKGVRLLARDTFNFNPAEPTREVVRKNNFNRRQTQMSAMGFRSANHKPYIGIGDPFYLDEKKMILHALGQWNEDEYDSSSSSEDSEEEEDASAGKKAAFTAAKFVLRRSRKDLNTLSKAVVHGRAMIRNVRLGHGLFDLINKEKQSKQAASEAERRRKQEAIRNEFQPPKLESDDETDDDLENDVDLTNYMVSVAPPTPATQQQTDTDEELGIIADNALSDSDQSPEREPEIITFSGMAIAEEEEEQRARSTVIPSEMPSRPVSSRKKKQQLPRPYTPQHTNLYTPQPQHMVYSNLSTHESFAEEEVPEQEFDISRDALFRQLCVLHWILEAMNVALPDGEKNPSKYMTPVTSCWSLADIGGSRVQQVKKEKDDRPPWRRNQEATEMTWSEFLNKESSRKVTIATKSQTVPTVNTNIPQDDQSVCSERSLGRLSARRKTIYQSPRTPRNQKVGKRLSSNRNRSPGARRGGVLVGGLGLGGRTSVQSSVGGSQQGSNLERDKVSSPQPSISQNKLASLLKPKFGVARLPRLLGAPEKQSMGSVAAQFMELKMSGERASPQPLQSKLSSLLKPKFGATRLPHIMEKPSTNSLAQFLELKMSGGLNALATQMSLLTGRNHGEYDTSPRIEEEDDQAYNKSIFKFLDEYYESLKKEEDAVKKDENKSPGSTPISSPVPQKQDDKIKEKKEKRKKSKKKKEDSSEEKRLDHKVAVALGEEEKMSSKFLRANSHLIRPKSSPALIEFQNSLPSNKKCNLRSDLHNKFAESREEKALTLHDVLEHKESQRLSVCQSKFVSLHGSIHGSSFHRAVKQMRMQSWQRLRKPINDSKKSIAKGNWFSELVERIPEDLKQEWYYKKIIQRLANFGLVEGTGKQSILQFLKVLQGLREWEICSPDVTAAVEFCREKIVAMTVEDYEWWFKEKFPKVTRPQTAPPPSKVEKKDGWQGTGQSATGPPSVGSTPARPKIRVVQSAMARRVQH